MVSQRAIQHVADEIARKFNPRKIILFGSYAKGTANDDSDVDLMIIIPHRGPGHEKATEIRMAIDIDFASDILVRSEEEIRARLKLDDYFIMDVLEEGKVLYEAGTARMGRQSRRGFQHHASRVSARESGQIMIAHAFMHSSVSRNI
jgi:predicted nucleotidyltransferase